MVNVLKGAEKTAANRRYQDRFPERRRAHKVVEFALRRGALTRGCCAVCGGTPAEAHHEDYSRPLVITWLCGEHHKQRHAELQQKTSRTA